MTGKGGEFVSASRAPRDAEVFAGLTEPYRRQIKAYCYRMVGSLQEAEDLTQESLLKAWNAFGQLENLGSIKSWLYQVATRVCLDALHQRKRRRRLLPEAEYSPATSLPDGGPAVDISWLEPYPDSELDNIADDAPGPDTRYEKREAIRLAFVAAIQYLPPRQRAVLLLIDVLGWSPAETASLVGGSVGSINSTLQRARTTLAQRYPSGRPEPRANITDSQTALLGRYVRAWEAQEIEGFVALLKADASFAMPPWRQWYLGPEAIAGFLRGIWRQCGRVRLLPTTANDQPAFVLYVENRATNTLSVHSLHVLTLERDSIAAVTAFMEPISTNIVQAFGLPIVLE